MGMRQVIGIIVLLGGTAAWGSDSDIRLNSLGFLPGLAKKATIIAACSDFAVKRASGGETVYTGAVEGPRHQDDVKQDV